MEFLKWITCLLCISWFPFISLTVVEDTFELLNMANQIFQSEFEMKNVVIFLDNIRTEKSSIALLAAADVDNLLGVQGDEKVIIRDEIDTNRINAPLNIVKDTRTRVTFAEISDIQESTSTALEIARAFFLEELCSRAESIKIVFVVDYEELQDEDKFINLLKFSTALTTNFTNFYEGIGLIVTEIDDDNNENNIAIKNRIVDILANSMNTGDELSNKLIKTLLERKSDDFPRIGLVRKVFEAGPLDEKVKEDKRYLETMISQEIKPLLLPKVKFSLSKAALSTIEDVASQMQPKIQGELEQIGIYIANNILDTISNSKDLHEAIDDLQKSHIIVQNYVHKYKREFHLEKTIKSLRHVAIDLGIPVDQTMAKVERFTRDIRILETLSGKTLNIDQWTKYLETHLRVVSDQKTWYDWLLNFRDFLSSKRIQKDKKRFKEALDRGILAIEKNRPVDRKIQEVLQIIKSTFRSQRYQDFSELQLNDVNLKHLNSVLDLILYNSSIYCTEESKIVKGYIITKEDIDSKSCSEGKRIAVFASDVIYLENGFVDFSKRSEVVLIASKIELIENVAVSVHSKLSNLFIITEKLIGNNHDMTIQQTNIMSEGRSRNCSIQLHLINVQMVHTDCALNSTPVGVTNKFHTDSIAKYRMFLIENLSNSLLNRHLQHFNTFLNENAFISGMYDGKALAEEFLIMEEHFLTEQVGVLPHYRNLLQRLDRVNEERGKLIVYLYSTIQCKIWSLRDMSDANLITDTRVFLKKALGNIKEMEHFHLMNSKIENNLKYVALVEKQGEEATKIIDTAIEQVNEHIKTFADRILEFEQRYKGAIRAQLQNAVDIDSTNQLMWTYLKRFCLIGKFMYYFIARKIPEWNAPEAFPGMQNIMKVGGELLQEMYKGKLQDIQNDLKLLLLHEKKFPKIGEEVRLLQEKVNALLSGAPNDGIVDSIRKEYLAIRKKLEARKKRGKTRNRVRRDAVQRHREQAANSLALFTEKMEGVVLPMLKMFQDELREALDSPGEQSFVRLETLQFRILRSVREVFRSMRKFTEGMDNDHTFTDLLRKVQDVITMIMNMSKKRQDEVERRKFATYLSELETASTLPVYDDDDLKVLLPKLEEGVKSSMVLMDYERGLRAFKQLAFPFAEHYLSAMELPEKLKQADLIQVAARNIKNLATILNKEDFQMTFRDEFVNVDEFCSDCGGSKPFYVWRNARFNKSIVDLLKGEEVYLWADASDAKNGVKFKKVHLKFKTHNDKLQGELDSRLESFRVEMKHMGNSYYRCDDKMYMIPGKGLTIKFTYEKDDQGYLIGSNGVYRKIERGDVMLSPYAMWKMKLVGGEFGVLERYHNHVDLCLEGLGYYISESSNVCKGPLDKYYDRVL